MPPFFVLSSVKTKPQNTETDLSINLLDALTVPPLGVLFFTPFLSAFNLSTGKVLISSPQRSLRKRERLGVHEGCDIPPHVREGLTGPYFSLQ